MKHLEYEIWKRSEESGEEGGIVPILCPLSRLKQPLTKLVQETLKREYGFNDINIRNFKVAAKEEKYKIVFLLDGYDEVSLLNQYKNLYDSNDLEKWGNPTKTNFPKVIITCRTEYLMSFSGYETLFYPEISSYPSHYFSKEYYFEVKIESFEGKKEEYIRKVYERAVGHLWIKGLYNSENWKKIRDQLFEKEIEKVKGEEVERFCRFNKESLSNIWHLNKYKEMKIFNDLKYLFETPFMAELVVEILPSIHDSFGVESEYKSALYYAFEKEGVKAGDIESVWESIASELEDRKPFDLKKIKETGKASIRFNPLLSDQQKNNCTAAIEKIFEGKTISRYQLYDAFIDRFFSRSTDKIKNIAHAGEIEKTSEDYRFDCEEYCQQLAVKMTQQQLSRVEYANIGQHFRLKNEWDQFFGKDTYLKEIRDGVPLSCSHRSYSFQHKSLGEFFVAKYIYQFFT